ncbi:hypothetical protein [Neogemmobacter tilapiae]|uniref:DUF2155 domain-containing protein n=1 Tax=Neogemmobacter tilapiae TaxID=875041 RepID=A0A918TSB2_9RHOB|nr:hypothetical protein [Gemmobacter tilapiae]GHC58778.1 hypothetical protein GCM10007315_23150 [Gemmobacter tilapiae]
MIKQLLVLALLLGAPLVPARAEVVVVSNDPGGNVLQYQARRRELAKAEQVRIQGYCNSACTIFTTLPNVCVGPKATFGFHGASPKTGVPQVDYFLDMQIGQFYRGEVRRRFIDKWRFHLGSKDLHYISAERLVQLDPKIRICPSPKRKNG